MQKRSLKADETPSDLSRKGYNKSALQYLEWTSSLPSPRLAWLDKLFQYLGPLTLPTAHVLELGCGAGIPCTLKLAKTVDRVVGTDISSTQLDLARQYFREAGLETSDDNSKVELREADMIALSFPPASFDAICAFYSIIQLSAPDQKLVLKRGFEWLKPGGYVLINVSKDASPGSVMEGWNGMDACYWSGYGTEGTLREMGEIGYDVVEQETIETEGDATFTWIIARKPIKDGT